MGMCERLTGIWLMTTALLALFAYAIYFVAQMWLNALHAMFLTLAVLQIAALILYMWGPEKLKSWPMKLLYRLLCTSSLCVIPAFAFIFMGLVSQYHVPIPESIPAESMPADQILPGDETTIYNTGTAYVFFPEYSEISLACEKRPSKSDASITWCSGAAFQHDVSLGFSQENIEGDHAVMGTLYESPYKVVTLFGLPVPWSHNWIVFER